jgi:hypothetical protein
MDDGIAAALRVLALVIAVAAIVGLILFARGPVDHGAQPAPSASVVEVIG